MSNGPEAHRKLDSWKEIATYIGRSVRTVIRWEQDNGLPVHRLPGGHHPGVFAYPCEIDEWLRSADNGHERELASAETPHEATEAQRKLRTTPKLSFRLTGSSAAWGFGIVSAAVLV